MILVMAVTALVGAAAAWRWGRALIGCTQQAREIRGNEVMIIYDVLQFTGILLLQPLIDSTLTADADIGRFLHPGEPPGQSGDLHRQRTFADFSFVKFSSQSILAKKEHIFTHDVSKNRGVPPQIFQF